MNLQHKTLRIESKSALVDFEARTFKGYAEVYGNRDEGGDVCVAGSFDKSMPRIMAGKVKLIDAHDYWSGTKTVVGKVLSAVSDSVGLLCTFYVAKGVEGDVLLNKIADGIIDALSIGYYVLDSERIEDPDTGEVTTMLKELKLVEVSVVIWGMNSLALIDPTSVKSLTVIPPALVEAAKSGDVQAFNAALSAALKSDTPSAPASSDEGDNGQDADAQKAADEAEALRQAQERKALDAAMLTVAASMNYGRPYERN